jgi:DNA-binding response OmpR family regulator
MQETRLPAWKRELNSDDFAATAARAGPTPRGVGGVDLSAFDNGIAMHNMPLVEQGVFSPLCRSQIRVLIVAQQIEVRARIARVLQSAGHNVELAESWTRALKLASGKKFEAAIVVHSSDLNGLGQEIREQIPRTIMLYPPIDEIPRWEHPPHGPEAQEFDEQKLLDQLRESIAPLAGADDGTSAEAVLTIEDCKFDLAGHVFVDGNGREVPLTRTEFALLGVFTRSPRRVLSRDQLRRAVGRRSAGPDDRSIDMLVARLRRKIEPNPKVPRFILSVAGVGYKFAMRLQSADHGKASATVEPLNRVGLGDDTLAQAQNAEPETPKFTVCVRLQGVEQRTALPLTPSMVRKLSFEAFIRNQNISELVGALLRMAAVRMCNS